jgi:hypothetical protein
MKIDKKTWQNNEIFRYKIVRGNGTIAYTCITAHLDEDFVLKELCKMFENTKDKFNIYCNGSLICRLNYYQAKRYDNIIHKQTGEIFKGIEHMAKKLNISEALCYHYIKHKNIYEWIKN